MSLKLHYMGNKSLLLILSTRMILNSKVMKILIHNSENKKYYYIVRTLSYYNSV